MKQREPAPLSMNVQMKEPYKPLKFKGNGVSELLKAAKKNHRNDTLSNQCENDFRMRSIISMMLKDKLPNSTQSNIPFQIK